MQNKQSGQKHSDPIRSYHDLIKVVLVVVDTQATCGFHNSVQSVNQSIFICIAPNHNRVVSKHFTHRAGSKPNSSGFNFKETQHSHISNSGKKKLPFNRKKPQAEPDSEWVNICLDRLGLRGERGRTEERSTMKINNEARRSGTEICHPDVYRPRLPVRRESTDNSGEEV